MGKTVHFRILEWGKMTHGDGSHTDWAIINGTAPRQLRAFLELFPDPVGEEWGYARKPGTKESYAIALLQIRHENEVNYVLIELQLQTERDLGGNTGALYNHRRFTWIPIGGDGDIRSAYTQEGLSIMTSLLRYSMKDESSPKLRIINYKDKNGDDGRREIAYFDNSFVSALQKQKILLATLLVALDNNETIYIVTPESVSLIDRLSLIERLFMLWLVEDERPIPTFSLTFLPGVRHIKIIFVTTYEANNVSSNKFFYDSPDHSGNKKAQQYEDYIARIFSKPGISTLLSELSKWKEIFSPLRKEHYQEASLRYSIFSQEKKPSDKWVEEIASLSDQKVIESTIDKIRENPSSYLEESKVRSSTGKGDKASLVTGFEESLLRNPKLRIVMLKILSTTLDINSLIKKLSDVKVAEEVDVVQYIIQLFNNNEKKIDSVDQIELIAKHEPKLLQSLLNDKNFWPSYRKLLFEDSYIHERTWFSTVKKLDDPKLKKRIAMEAWEAWRILEINVAVAIKITDEMKVQDYPKRANLVKLLTQEKINGIEDADLLILEKYLDKDREQQPLSKSLYIRFKNFAIDKENLKIATKLLLEEIPRMKDIDLKLEYTGLLKLFNNDFKKATGYDYITQVPQWDKSHQQKILEIHLGEEQKLHLFSKKDVDYIVNQKGDLLPLLPSFVVNPAFNKLTEDKKIETLIELLSSNRDKFPPSLDNKLLMRVYIGVMDKDKIQSYVESKLIKLLLNQSLSEGFKLLDCIPSEESHAKSMDKLYKDYRNKQNVTQEDIIYIINHYPDSYFKEACYEWLKSLKQEMNVDEVFKKDKDDDRNRLSNLIKYIREQGGYKDTPNSFLLNNIKTMLQRYNDCNSYNDKNADIEYYSQKNIDSKPKEEKQKILDWLHLIYELDNYRTEDYFLTKHHLYYLILVYGDKKSKDYKEIKHDLPKWLPEWGKQWGKLKSKKSKPSVIEIWLADNDISYQWNVAKSLGLSGFLNNPYGIFLLISSIYVLTTTIRILRDIWNILV